MGQSLSSEQPVRNANPLETQNKAMHEETTRFERLSLKKHMGHITSLKTEAQDLINQDPPNNGNDTIMEIFDEDGAVLDELGIRNAPGSDIMLRMAQHLTHNELSRWPLVAIGWFTGRLPQNLGIGEYEWRKTLFAAAASSEVGGEPYISFDELADLVLLLLSAFDWDPQDRRMLQINVLDSPDVAARVLAEVKLPAIQFDQFNTKVLDKYPYLMQLFGCIWSRLLFDDESTVSVSPRRKEPGGDALAVHSNTPNPVSERSSMLQFLPRSQAAVLYINLGPQLFSSLPLFRGTTDGFAMRAFEVGVVKWPSSTVMIVKGNQPKNFEKLWSSKHKEIDQFFPHVFDVPLKPAKQLVFAVFVDEPWKVSYKTCSGGTRCRIIQLEPEIHTYELPAKSVFLTPKIGFGAGLPHLPHINERAKGTVLFIDSSMEHALFRHMPEDQHGDRFEHRFFVKQVEVLGCGSQADLEKQRRAWEWEERESQRRQNVNVHEDRAILEMAGIVGQYSS